jgi:hypothetical protein
MGRQWLLPSVGTGASIAVLLAGCGHTQHAEPQTCSCVCIAAPSARSNVVVQNTVRSPAPLYSPVPPATPQMVIVPSDRLPEPPTESTSAKPAEAHDSGVLRVDENPTITLKHVEKVPRRSFADITAKPGYAHAPDYSWVAGELQFLHARKVWRVRYASVEEEDRYGGGMTLIDAGPMTEFQDGQMVRVEGQVADVTSHDSEYRVHHIQPLAKTPE